MGYKKDTMKILRNDSGMALAMVIIFTVVNSFLLAGFYTLVEFEAAFTQGRTDDSQAFHYAEGAAAWGLNKARRVLGSALSNKLYSSDPETVTQDMEDYKNTGTTEGVVYFLEDYLSDMFDSYQTEGSPLDTFIGTHTPGVTLLANSCDPVTFTFTATEPIRKNGGTRAYIIPFSCTIQATGKSGDYSRTVTFTFPALEIEVKRDSFARYSLFVDEHGNGAADRWFHRWDRFMGPVHTNNYFNVRENPAFYKPIPRLSYSDKDFSGRVTQCNKEAQFWNEGPNIFLDADKNRDIDVPNFEDGCYRNHPLVDLLDPELEKNRHIRLALGLGTSDPIPALAGGVYVPIDNDTTKNVIGGIYVKGDPILMYINAKPGDEEEYEIDYSKVNKITVDYANNTTSLNIKEPEIIKDTYNGIPNGIIYVDGQISTLRGVVHQNDQVTIAAGGDIRIANHIRYDQHVDFDYYGDGTLNPNAEGYNSILGIISWGGDVIVDQNAFDDLEIHAIIMAPQGGFRVPGYGTGGDRHLLTLLGSCITKYYYDCGTGTWDAQNGEYDPQTGYERNFIYDIRVQLGMYPPHFPKVQNFTSTTKDTTKNVSIYTATPVWHQM